MSSRVLTHSREREEAVPPPMSQCMLEILSAPSPRSTVGRGCAPGFKGIREVKQLVQGHTAISRTV